MKAEKKIYVDASLLSKIIDIRNHYGLKTDNKAIYKAIETLHKQIELFNKDEQYFNLRMQQQANILGKEFTDNLKELI